MKNSTKKTLSDLFGGSKGTNYHKTCVMNYLRCDSHKTEGCRVSLTVMAGSMPPRNCRGTLKVPKDQLHVI